MSARLEAPTVVHYVSAATDSACGIVLVEHHGPPTAVTCSTCRAYIGIGSWVVPALDRIPDVVDQPDELHREQCPGTHMQVESAELRASRAPHYLRTHVFDRQRQVFVRQIWADCFHCNWSRHVANRTTYSLRRRFLAPVSEPVASDSAAQPSYIGRDRVACPHCRLVMPLARWPRPCVACAQGATRTPGRGAQTTT